MISSTFVDCVVNGLKVLDPKRPIREADIAGCRDVPDSDIAATQQFLAYSSSPPMACRCIGSPTVKSIEIAD
jgi:hypothetical protein